MLYMKKTVEISGHIVFPLKEGVSAYIACSKGIVQTSKVVSVKNDTKEFAEGIFETAVPPELVYEKNSNPVGLKKSDWSKLVDVQTKLMMAQPGEQLEKAETQLNDLAADKQFDQERARLMQVKLSTMEIQHDEE
jgi:hypothetical protein